MRIVSPVAHAASDLELSRRARRRKVIVLAGAIGAVLVAAVALLALPGPISRLRRPAPASAAYPSAAECATCHPVETAEWRSSAHAYAGDNILVHASVCGPCHAPIGTQLDPEYLFKVKSGTTLPAMPASASEGVTCVACHAETHSPENHVLTLEPEWPNWRTTDLAIRVSAFDTARGPFGGGTADDPAPVANTAHESVLDSRLSSAEMCRPCHDVVLDKGPLAELAGGPQPLVRLLTTYAEWAASDYRLAGETCQSCHMPRMAVPAPAAVAPEGVRYDEDLPPRARVDHSTLGVDTAYWDKSASVEMQARKSAAHLKGAASVALGIPSAMAPGDTVTVTVTIDNDGTGHDLMTGFSFWREAWLEITATDSSGRVLLSSGVLDDEGWLFDEFSPSVRRDPALYDPYLLQLRTRLVRSPANLSAWLQPDRTVTVPESAIDRNYNGTPILSWAEFDAAPIVARLERAEGGAAPDASPLEEVYTLRYAESLLRNGVVAGATRQARYPLVVDAEATGPLTVSARLLLRALGRQMTQQQEEIRDDPPIEPVYEIAAAQATIRLRADTPPSP